MADSTDRAGAAHLTWGGAAFLSEDDRERLLGPGAPFEMATQTVLGAPVDVFVRRPTSLFDLLRSAAAEDPDLVYLVDGDRTWTFAAALADVEAIAAHLVDAYGIGPGDRVGIVAANSAEYALVIWAVFSLGAIVAGLNGWWTTAELDHGISLVDPSLVLGDALRLARLEGAASVEGIEVARLDEVVADALAAAAERDVDAPARPARDVDEDDPAVILFTSGTTGRPRGATLAHRSFIHFAQASQLGTEIGAALLPQADGSGHQPASILSSPMFHVSGLLGVVMSGPVLRTKMVIPPPGRWDESTHLELTDRHGVTAWSGVPTQFLRLLRHPDLASYDLSTLVRVGSGGAPFPPELVRLILDELPDVQIGNGFGMSETAGFGTISMGPLMVHAPESVGPVQPGAEVQIRRPDGSVADDGEVGEIHMRSPSVFLGYWNDPDATGASLDEGRWYRTGDFGRTGSGMLYLESRRRDLILRGGENVYPIEVENRLVEHAEVDEAAVVGVAHDTLGQEVVAVVVPTAGASPSAAALQEWVAVGLARFKVPAHVIFRDELPYTETGKVLKRDLEIEVAAELARGSGSVG